MTHEIYTVQAIEKWPNHIGFIRNFPIGYGAKKGRAWMELDMFSLPKKKYFSESEIFFKKNLPHGLLELHGLVLVGS